MFSRFWLHVSGSEPYLYSIFITALAVLGMYWGKLDWQAGMGIIATMGLGSTLHLAKTGGDQPGASS